MCTYRRTREQVLDHSLMEKCVLIGYPQGYKGWKFYNPTTKKTVICERADFDERYFPLSKHPTSASFAHLGAAVENTPAITPPPVPRPSTVAPKPATTSYYISPDSDDSDSDDESSSDESLDHGGDIVFKADNHSLSSQSVAHYISYR
jgi:hypothetical protein